MKPFDEAIAAYREVASTRPYVLLSSLFWAVLIAGIVIIVMGVLFVVSFG